MSFPNIHDAYGGFGEKSEANMKMQGSKPASKQ